MIDPERASRTVPGAGAIVVRRGDVPEGDRLLMVRQARASGVRWEIPGGNQESTESLEQTAAREVAEECGIAVTLGELVCTYLLMRGERATLGAYFVAEPTDPSATPRTRVPHEIIEAAYLDPVTLAADEIGPVSRVVIRRWWPRRARSLAQPFHVAVRRTPTGYAEL